MAAVKRTVLSSFTHPQICLACFEEYMCFVHTMKDNGVQCSVNFDRHFLFNLSLYLETKMLNSLSHILVIWVFHSFSLVLVDEKLLHFCQLLVITFNQTAVTNIYFGSYFSLQTKIVINSSLFGPNQLSLWEILIKDWIWKNWNKWWQFSFLGRDTN